MEAPANVREDVVLADMAYCSEPTVKLIPGDAAGLGLLDSGASVCLRQAAEGEISECVRKTVSLAVGKEEMWVNPAGSIVAQDPIDPIVSLPQLIAIGYHLKWTEKGLQLRDRKGRSIPVSTSDGCPQVARSKALNMIQEIEHQLCAGKRARVNLAKAGAVPEGTDRAQLLGQMRDKVLAGEDASEFFRQWIMSVFPDIPDILRI